MPKQFLRMYLAEEQAEAAVEGSPIRFLIATEGIKRDGLNLKVAGARVDNYLRNPVVTWVHDFMGQRLPIGRANLILGPNQIDAEITFDQMDDFARQVESKYRRGYLNAVSVSWNPLRMDGRNVEEWEFLELAAVPVPGDPEALIKRQYEALGELLGDEEGAQGASGSEDGWAELATEMVAVFLPGSDEDAAGREGRYRALLPRYRRMGKVAPEFLSDEDLRGLDSRTLEGHFLEGEWGLVYGNPGINSGARGERKGAMLSTRNLDDLRQAVELLQGVLERAKKEEPNAVGEGQHGGGNGDDPDEDPHRADEAEAVRALQSIWDGLRKLEV